VFSSSVASRAVFTPFLLTKRASSEGVTAEQKRRLSEDHARRLVTALTDGIRILSTASDPRLDPKDFLQGALIGVAAMVYLRIQDYGIGIKTQSIFHLYSLFHLNEKRRDVIRHILIPHVRRELELGRRLTEQESKAVMAEAFRNSGLRDI
jgi:hypothetical protein